MGVASYVSRSRVIREEWPASIIRVVPFRGHGGITCKFAVQPSEYPLGMLDFTEIESIRAVLNRAREHLRPADLCNLVMSDPGGAGYVAAFSAVLREGSDALCDGYEGRRLIDSFDIGENLLLSHHDSARSTSHRWFSVLTSSIELLGWDGYDGVRGFQPAQSLCQLWVDSRALVDQGQDAPVDLFPSLATELQTVFTNPHHQALALLWELLVSPLDATTVEAKCLQLQQYHEDFQAWDDEKGNVNPWFVRRADFVWSAILQGSYGGTPSRRDVRLWGELVKTSFPSASPLAKATRQKLVHAAAAWHKVK